MTETIVFGQVNSMEILEMKNLEMIKRHVDEHGVGCVVMSDHVAILMAARAANGDGLDTEIARVKSIKEACSALGCDCAVDLSDDASDYAA